MKQRGSVQYVVLAVVSLLSVWVFFNQRAIRDWWSLHSYDPPADIVALADSTSLSNSGRRLFYISRPQVDEREEFNQNCVFEEKSLVLGCYAARHIYIYNVTNEQLDGIKQVTAAHELLHAVYARMDNAEREHIDKLTAQVFDGLNDSRLKEVIDGYRKDDAAAVPNELHSILGSEVRDLPPELEEHYAHYFDDRQAVVALSESYEAVFTKLRGQLDDLQSQIDAAKAAISQTEADLASRKQTLDSEAGHLNQLKSDGQIAEYNKGVPGYNADVVTYNQLIGTYKSQVASYNRLVDKYNDIALEQNQLIQSIDSQYQTIN